MTRKSRLLGELCVLLLCAAPMLAQQATGVIGGTVVDQQGLGVAGANVTVVNINTKFSRTFTTAEDGIFRFPAVPIGNYTLTIQKDKFQTLKRPGVVVTERSEIPIHATLQVGAISEEIVVTAPVPLVDTETASVKATFGEELVRRFGVKPLLSTLASNTGGSYPGWLTFNGGRTEFNRWSLNGAQNQESLNRTEGALPDVEAIAEVNVVSTLAKAEQGQSSAQINVVTKSGSDALHGHVHMPLPNRWNFVARTFFQARQKDPFGRPINPQSRGLNYYSGSVGGPVILPKIYNGRGKTHFYFLWGGQRSETPAVWTPTVGAVPTQAFRDGDFSSLVPPAGGTNIVRDPVTGAPFPGNRIPADRINPLAKKVLNTFVPLPNMPDGKNFFLNAFTETDMDQMISRIDHQVSQKQQVTFNVNKLRSEYELPVGNIEQFRNISDFSQIHFGFSHIYTITPRLLNEFRAMTYRNHLQLHPKTYFDPKSFGFTGINSNTAAFPYISISGYSAIGASSAVEEITNSFEVKDDFSWTHGKHGLKFGFDYVWNQGVQNNNIFTSGYFLFLGLGTAGLCPAPIFWCGGNPVADFLLGRPYIYIQYSPAQSDIRYKAINAYAQDDWKVGSRVTLNLGFRWEGNTAPADAQDRMSAYRPGMKSTRFPAAPAGIVFQGDPGVPGGTVGNSMKNFSPRLGIAWDVFGSGKTVVRTGYGIYYQTNPLRQPVIGSVNQPFSLSVVLLPTLINPPPKPFEEPFGTSTNPFPYRRTAAEARFYTPYSLIGLAEGYTTPYTQQFSLGIQQQLFSPNYVISVGYTRTLGVHLQGVNEYNAAKMTPDATANNIQQRRPNQNFSTVTLYDTTHRSYFNSLMVSFNKRYSRGFMYGANYTWSKNTDTMSLNYGPKPQNPYDVAAERALSALDVRHKFSGNFLYDLPDFPFLKKGTLATKLLGGWQWNGLWQIQTGSPQNLQTGTNNSFNGAYTDRPNIVGKWRLLTNRSNIDKADKYFNTAAFQVNAPGTFGTLGRNVIIGPGHARVDMGLVKKFAIDETKRFEIETRATNLFNRVNFAMGNIAWPLNSPNYGKLTIVHGGRAVNFIAKFYF